MNNFIISLSNDQTLRVWDQSTYELIKIIYIDECSSRNALAEVNKIVLLGGENKIYSVDIESSEVNEIENKSLGRVLCLKTLSTGLVVIGNDKGEILCYHSSSKQFIFKRRFHRMGIFFIIETKTDELISSSYDQTLNIYHFHSSFHTYKNYD